MYEEFLLLSCTNNLGMPKNGYYSTVFTEGATYTPEFDTAVVIRVIIKTN